MLNLIPYEIMKLLGWATVILVSLSTTFHLLLHVNKRLIKYSGSSNANMRLKKTLKKVIPLIHSYHAIFGTMALLTGISHGYLLLRSFEIHTGYLTWSMVLIMGLSGAFMKLNRGKKYYKLIRKIHTALMYLTVSVMIFHIVLMRS